jgi:hypothetical protein
MSRKGIPGKKRQKKEASQNSAELVVRDGQLRKLRWQRILILRRFLLPTTKSQPSAIWNGGILPTALHP